MVILMFFSYNEKIFYLLLIINYDQNVTHFQYYILMKADKFLRRQQTRVFIKNYLQWENFLGSKTSFIDCKIFPRFCFAFHQT